jgi:oxygen-independent coproporphyrinogen-3 oxidase
LRYKNELIAALLKEIELQRSFLMTEQVETIYFGGGTPSLCTTEELQMILAAVHANFDVAAGAEITLEANPDDIVPGKPAEWRQIGINRLSIGIQSFFEEDLRWMNRAHSAEQARNNLQLARDHFDNITIDLIYGTPQLSNEKWQANVETAIGLNIPHLSCYALTVEPKTPLDKMIRLHESPDIDTDRQSEQFLLLMGWMDQAGYEHYEISNFARPGFRSRHNSSYWQGKKYIGIGPSAHSFDGISRQWNVSNNNIYIESLKKGELSFEREVLTVTQRLNEYIMISLRTSEGMDLGKAEAIGVNEKGEDGTTRSQLVLKSKKYIASGLMRLEGDTLRLTKDGRLLADGIAADLFMDQ